MAPRVAVQADDGVLAEVIALVLERAGFAPVADEAPVAVYARRDRIEVFRPGEPGRRAALRSPLWESDLVAAVRRTLGS